PLHRTKLSRVGAPSLRTQNKQSEAAVIVTDGVLSAKSDPILPRRVNRTVIFPRFNRIRALRLRMPPSVWLPSFDILNSSILISELLDICARVAGISPRLSSAPSDVRTISPSWIRLSRVTG